MIFYYQFLIPNQYLLQECNYNDFFSIGIALLVNVVLFVPLNIFSLAIKYLSSRTGPTVNFTFKNFLTTSHISLYFSLYLLLNVVRFFFLKCF